MAWKCNKNNYAQLVKIDNENDNSLFEKKNWRKMSILWFQVTLTDVIKKDLNVETDALNIASNVMFVRVQHSRKSCSECSLAMRCIKAHFSIQCTHCSARLLNRWCNLWICQSVNMLQPCLPVFKKKTKFVHCSIGSIFYGHHYLRKMKQLYVSSL